jgi:hypothetical protein
MNMQSFLDLLHRDCGAYNLRLEREVLHRLEKGRVEGSDLILDLAKGSLIPAEGDNYQAVMSQIRGTVSLTCNH